MRERQLADVAHGDALGDGVAARRHRLAGQQLAHRPSSPPVSTPITLMSGLSPRAATAQPAIMPPPPTGTTRVSSSGTSSQHLQRDRALAGDDARIVVGMDEHQPLGRGQAMRLGAGLGQRVAVQHDPRAMTAGVLTFMLGVKDGMTMVAGMPSRAGVIGDALGVVAGRHGDHAALALVGRELQQRVERAALLERGGELQVLELDPDVGLGDARQRLAAQAGRAHDRAGDAPRRRARRRRA